LPKRDGRALARVIAANAERDAVAVEKMAPDPELADEVVGLHAQQAAEKYLKAVLAHRGITYRRVHSITYLLGLLEDHEVPAPPRAAELETEGAVLDRKAAVELVHGVQEWARDELGA
jgi:hypothetical protein